MASEVIDLLLGRSGVGAGRRVEQAHSDAMSQQQVTDISNAMQELTTQFRDMKQLQYQLRSGEIRPSEGEPARAAKEVELNLQRDLTRSLQDYLKSQGGGKEDWEVYQTAQRISRARSLEEFNEQIEKATGSYKEFNRAAERAGGSRGFISTLLGAAGAAAVVGGAMTGNVLQLAMGGVAIGEGFRRERMRQQQIDEAKEQGVDIASMYEKLVPSPMLRQALSVFTTGTVYALQASIDRALQDVPRALQLGMGVERARAMGATGLGYMQLTGRAIGQDQFAAMGAIAGQDVLGIQRRQQMVDLFAQTGGGTQADLARAMRQFAEYTVVYGESAQQMMQATRGLQMWIPDGDMGKVMRDALNASEAQGVPRALQLEQIQAFSQYGRQLAISGYQDRGAVADEARKAIQYADRLGLHGAAGVQAVQGFQGGFAGAVQNTPQFAALMAAGFSPQEIFAIASGEKSINKDQIQQLSSYLGTAMGGTPEYVQSYITRMLIPMAGGRIGGELLERGRAGEEVVVGELGARRGRRGIGRQAYAAVTGEFANQFQAMSSVYTTESERVRIAFHAGMKSLVQANQAIQQELGNRMVASIAGLAEKVDNVIGILRGRVPTKAERQAEKPMVISTDSVNQVGTSKGKR